nr:hypothetical protein [Oribacterium sp. WCC10]
MNRVWRVGWYNDDAAGYQIIKMRIHKESATSLTEIEEFKVIMNVRFSHFVIRRSGFGVNKNSVYGITYDWHKNS